jgi:hypothetical protein
MKKIILLFVLAFSISINAQVKDSTSVDSFKKTDEVLAEVVKKALLVAEKTGDFVIEQAPMLLKEFYAWHIWSSVFFIFIGIGFMFFGFRLPYLWLSKEKGRYDSRYFKRFGEEEVFLAWSSFTIGMAIGVSMVIINLYDLVYILVAPKLYLIDYFIK